MMDHWGHFQIKQELFLGDEICILRATAADHSPVVLKMSRQDPCSEALAGRLHHELAVLNSLADVPGVIKTRGLERIGGQLALVLEDTQSRSLREVLLSRGGLPLADALHITRSAAAILEAVHTAGLIHKDIKPHKSN